jgi:uncharacterized membrane protein YgcG
MKNLFLSILAFGLVACSPALQHQVDKPTSDRTVNEYHYQNDDGSWIWYYVLLNHVYGSNHQVSTNTYYYSTPTRLTSSNYAEVPFRSADKMELDEAKQTLAAVEKGEQTNSANVAEEEIPPAVQATEHDELNSAYAEYEQEQNAIDAQQNASENPAPTEGTSDTTSAPTDSGGGSSGGDSGGSDGGGSSSSE